MTDLDNVYRERQHLVAHLAAIYPSVITSEDDDWSIVYIQIPTGQISWHIGKSDMDLFKHVENDDSIKWDGHTTEEKYARLDEFTTLCSQE
jgi:hypothetical protein